MQVACPVKIIKGSTTSITRLSSTFEELNIRECSCSLEDGQRGSIDDPWGDELVHEMLGNSLNTLGLTTNDSLVGSFARQEWISTEAWCKTAVIYHREWLFGAAHLPMTSQKLEPS